MTLLDYCENVFGEHRRYALPLKWLRYASGLEIDTALTRAVRDIPKGRSLFGSTDLWPMAAGWGANRRVHSMPPMRRPRG